MRSANEWQKRRGSHFTAGKTRISTCTPCRMRAAQGDFFNPKGSTRNIKGAHFTVSCDRWKSPLTERSAVMNQEKYIGMDVHQATISVAVMDSSSKLIMECILETKAATILEFIAGLRGTLSVTFEEGTSAAWLHDLLKPHVSHLVVCDPRRNALLKDGSCSRDVNSTRLNPVWRTRRLRVDAKTISQIG